MHLYICIETGALEKIPVYLSMHLNSEARTLFPVVHFHASQVGYTPVVKRSNVLHIRKVEK